MKAEGLTPSGAVAIIAVDRTGLILWVPEELQRLHGRNVADFAAPWNRAELSEWVTVASPREPLGPGAVTFDVLGRRTDGLPAAYRLSAVQGPPAGAPDADLWLTAQPLGGPVVHAHREAFAGPSRSGWDHVLNHDVRSSLRNARSFTGLYHRRLIAAAAGLPDEAVAALPDPALLDTALRALTNADRAMEDVVHLHRIDTDLLVVEPAAVADLTVSATGAAEERLAELVAADHPELAGGLTVLGPGGGPDGVRVMGDDALLTWVLAELMVNARKFAGGPTVLTVTAEEAEGWAVVRVANTGEPVDAELAEDAFALGRQLQARGLQPGVGLGLPLARRIVTRHAGRLRFVPDPDGSGTVLELCLVAAETVRAGPSPTDAARGLHE